MEIQENILLKDHTTFEIGGVAKYFVVVHSKEELQEALEYAQTKNLAFTFIAGGSNILASDSGFDGLVIKMALVKHSVDTEKNEVQAEAGASLMEVIHAACSAGLTGMEPMYGIPGTIGGAVRGNAGAFGVEVVDILSHVTAIDIESKEIRTFTNEECAFDYRDSFFKRNSNWIILSATFSLAAAESTECIKKAEEILATRNERQIQNIRSAGSFFMNPIVSEELQREFEKEKGTPARNGRVPAGWLIEKAGFKGVVKDKAATGERSSNYVINRGAATAAMVQELTSEIQGNVEEKFGVKLEREVTQMGF
ncbi:UDP-N-acetylmuramate dehydrogenase [Candidatus Kaiserbacteria bacterium]|nr:MAG: UDP-N-acetylmuramate dehydrogenase [Candidatus Kaiserbacteria bacterium]